MEKANVQVYKEYNVSRLKSWHWLCILYIAAPAVMLLGARFFGGAWGMTFAMLYRIYGDYFISPLPGEGATGVFGLLLALLMLLRCILRGDRRDLYMTVTLANACMLGFLGGYYYMPLAML